MKCATCGRKDAPGLVSVTSNVHERICETCAASWETHARTRVTTTRPGAVLMAFRCWQDGARRTA